MVFFFFLLFTFKKSLKFVLGLPKWEFSTGKKHFTLAKNLEKWLCPFWKISSYAPVHTRVLITSSIVYPCMYFSTNWTVHVFQPRTCNRWVTNSQVKKRLVRKLQSYTEGTLASCIFPICPDIEARFLTCPRCNFIMIICFQYVHATRTRKEISKEDTHQLAETVCQFMLVIIDIHTTRTKNIIDNVTWQVSLFYNPKGSLTTWLGGKLCFHNFPVGTSLNLYRPFL